MNDPHKHIEDMQRFAAEKIAALSSAGFLHGGPLEFKLSAELNAVETALHEAGNIAKQMKCSNS